MKVVLVTHDSVYARYFARALYDAGAVDRVCIETGRLPLRFYWRKLRRSGLLDAIVQPQVNRWFRREGARHLPPAVLPPHERIDSVNHVEVDDDDLVVGFGTSYVTPRTLERFRRGILNLHTGLLPDYRGVKSEFWTLLAGDHQRAGWTLHYMTPALDAGDIVLQRTIAWQGGNPASLRAALLRDAVPAIAELVSRVRRQGHPVIPRRPQGDGRYYTTPGWRDWWRYLRSRRTA